MFASRILDSDARKAFALQQGADGIPVAEICRRAGISPTSYFDRKKYEGLLPAEMRRLERACEAGGRSRAGARSLQNVIRGKL